MTNENTKRDEAVAMGRANAEEAWDQRLDYADPAGSYGDNVLDTAVELGLEAGAAWDAFRARWIELSGRDVIVRDPLEEAAS